MVDRPRSAFGQKSRARLCDDRVVLGMDAGERPGLPRDAERPEDPGVVEADIVGGEDLEGAMALADEGREVGLVVRRPAGPRG